MKRTKPKRKVVKRQSADATGTTYDAGVCKKVMDLGRKGKSPAQIRSALNIMNSQWASWIRHHVEFKKAVEESYFLAMAFWEDAGMVGMTMGVRFNASAYIFLMKNMFRGDYRDRQEHDVTGVQPINLIISPVEANL